MVVDLVLFIIIPLISNSKKEVYQITVNYRNLLFFWSQTLHTQYEFESEASKIKANCM